MHIKHKTMSFFQSCVVMVCIFYYISLFLILILQSSGYTCRHWLPLVSLRVRHDVTNSTTFIQLILFSFHLLILFVFFCRHIKIIVSYKQRGKTYNRKSQAQNDRALQRRTARCIAWQCSHVRRLCGSGQTCFLYVTNFI